MVSLFLNSVLNKISISIWVMSHMTRWFLRRSHLDLHDDVPLRLALHAALNDVVGDGRASVCLWLFPWQHHRFIRQLWVLQRTFRSARFVWGIKRGQCQYTVLVVLVLMKRILRKIISNHIKKLPNIKKYLFMSNFIHYSTGVKSIMIVYVDQTCSYGDKVDRHIIK